MGKNSSKPLKTETSYPNDTISRLTLPEHTNNLSALSLREFPNIKLSPPQQPYHAKSNLQTLNGNHHSERFPHKYQSPYSIFNSTHKPQQEKGEDVNSSYDLKVTHKSFDSLRQTHLDQKTKKSTLKQKFQIKPDRISKSAIHNSDKPYTHNLKAHSTLNPHIKIISSDGSVQKPFQALIEDNEQNLPPPNIDDIQTIRITDRSRSNQLGKSYQSYDKGHGNLRSSRTSLNEMVYDEKYYQKRGYYLPTDTNLGEKKVSEMTAPGSEQNSGIVETSIMQWIVIKFCGAKQQNPESEVEVRKGTDCELFTKIKKQTMTKREEDDNFELLKTSTKKDRNLLDKLKHNQREVDNLKPNQEELIWP